MSVIIHTGDCRTLLSGMAAGSVDCCVTSPPYFGLRDYGTASWEGGNDGCDHKQTTARKDGGRAGIDGFNGSSRPDSNKGAMNYRKECGKCGAIRSDLQMGLEPTPDEYVAGMIEVFRHVRRVLRDDGTLWLNIGDSYNAAPAGNKVPSGFSQTRPSRRTGNGDQETVNTGRRLFSGAKQKDLLGIPWMLAFALRADGWYLRQDIIWSKPNPMPESVRDRCTKAHEYLFLLSKSQRYYFDAEAIKEDCVRGDAGSKFDSGQTAIHQLGRASAMPRKQRKPAGWDTGEGGHGSFHRQGRAEVVEYTEAAEDRRNKRSVWEVATQPYSEAHFATYPPALIEPCILAGCPKGGTVLDPFGGAGTTGMVADRLQRNAVLIELNPEYAAIARRRIDGDRGGLLDAMEAA